MYFGEEGVTDDSMPFKRAIFLYLIHLCTDFLFVFLWDIAPGEALSYQSSAT